MSTLLVMDGGNKELAINHTGWRLSRKGSTQGNVKAMSGYTVDILNGTVVFDNVKALSGYTFDIWKDTVESGYHRSPPNVCF